MGRMQGIMEGDGEDAGYHGRHNGENAGRHGG